MVHKMYKQYARPLARVVYGLQASWDPVRTAVYDERSCYKAVWSPCNRFIAVSYPGTVEIRDATTLNLLSNFESPTLASGLSFSPDSRFLTQIDLQAMITWDLQTGVSVTTTSPELVFKGEPGFSPAYSMDGKILATQCYDRDSWNILITTHDLSTTHMHVYRVSEGDLVFPFWTHREFFRFATVGSGRIAIWQTEFTLAQTPELVESFPAPDEIGEDVCEEYLFLPTISRLAIAFRDTLLVWDARDSKRLLKVSDSRPSRLSFSSDGRLFACTLEREDDTGIHIWKESSAGYVLHRKLAFGNHRDSPRPLLSPDGESIILLGDSTTPLLHTEDLFLSSHPTLAMDQSEFVLSFSPNGALAAFTRYTENAVTVLDLQSGDQRLEIDTDVEAQCLGVNGSTLVAADHEKVVTWKLATRNAGAHIHDSVRIPTSSPPPLLFLAFHPVSVFPDLSRTITLSTDPEGHKLAICDVSTGKNLAGPTSAKGALKLLSTPRARFKATDVNGHVGVETAWPTTDGREIWGASVSGSPVCRWGVIEDGESGTTKLQPLMMTACPPGVLPWRSSRGYEVTHDGWILSPTKKRLLWLPHRWRSDERYRKWGERFLGLLHSGLPEVVILEFLD